MKCKDRHIDPPHLRVLVDWGGFLRFYESWIYRANEFNHRYRSESAVYLSCFVGID